MKVSIGAKIIDGPWGGGNLFVKNLSNFLISEGHNVVYDLNDIDIDIIILTDPRKSSESSTYTHEEILDYLQNINSNAVVIHRINECDERKNTKNVNKTLLEANKIADATIFVSTWLMNLFLSIGMNDKNASVIYAGADENIFNSKGRVEYSSKNKLKIVTHHWGNNWNKGFDVYSKLDDLIGTSEWSEKIEFTYVVNLPKNFNFKNSNYISPLDGLELASELKKHHLYITASINEPSGNHHIEAAQCSLPLLFIDSGGIPEYCNDYGLIFNENNFKIKLFVGYEEGSAVQGTFVVTPNTKVLQDVGVGASIISVDSTIGFKESGKIISGINTNITYTNKSINQFFGCSGISSAISETDSIRSDESYFGYENGDTSKKVEISLLGVLSDFTQISDTLNVSEGDEIFVSNLGEIIDNPSDKAYKEIFAN